MPQNNPFNIAFGELPKNFISRIMQTNEILHDFQSETPSSRVYVITGVRGSGKTVLMTELAKELSADKQWLVINLNPERDMLYMLAAALGELRETGRKSVKASLDVHAFGVGVAVEKRKQFDDVEIEIRKMLEKIKKQKKRLLITVDEVTNNQNIRTFASAFQILIREEAPVFLLMTGLYENIHSLQNQKGHTFLYRAPKVRLEPLNATAIRKAYQDVFHIPEETATEMARITCGYSFAFQVLGFLFWKCGKEMLRKDKERAFDMVLPQFDQYLEEYVYEKIWSELSGVDQRILIEMVKNNLTSGADIQKALDVTPQYFYNYKKRLDQKGIVTVSKRGFLTIQLPRFDDFVRRIAS